MRFEISFSGHENILALHQKTLEITRESRLTLRGDCIVGVNASCGCSGIPDALKEKLRSPETRVTFTIKTDSLSFLVHGRGDPNLILTHDDDIVIRKSDFICPRTLAIQCDAAADLLPRKMVESLQNPNTVGHLIIDAD